MHSIGAYQYVSTYDGTIFEGNSYTIFQRFDFDTFAVRMYLGFILDIVEKNLK
ncbi:hypothetical protein PENSUB_10205 [Penicillium subrubescens]|jgi:hypothetical protein|uniref:Uncharacterized protein n=1 Tax=Penicillium subrubescens TaxID=1316194 RepID=A0A1Q5TB36_9EURO|nr:hypothetical protein PENSUB_10205 [Penicillium subrubescens]